MAPRFSNSQLDKILATSQGKSYTIVVVTVALILIIALVGVFPAVSAIIFQASENQAREAALAKVQTKDRILRKLTTEEEEKRAVGQALNHFFPDGYGQDVIYGEITTIIAATGVELIGINFGELSERRSLAREFKVPETVAGNTVTISLTGTREQIVEFIEQIEDSPRIMNITGISEFRVEGSELGEHRAEIQAEFYYWLVKD